MNTRLHSDRLDRDEPLHSPDADTRSLALRRLTRALDSLSDRDSEANALLARADQYEASAPRFADELRLAATAGATTTRTIPA